MAPTMRRTTTSSSWLTTPRTAGRTLRPGRSASTATSKGMRPGTTSGGVPQHPEAALRLGPTAGSERCWGIGVDGLANVEPSDRLRCGGRAECPVPAWPSNFPTAGSDGDDLERPGPSRDPDDDVTRWRVEIRRRGHPSMTGFTRTNEVRLPHPQEHAGCDPHRPCHRLSATPERSSLQQDRSTGTWIPDVRRVGGG